MTDKIHYQKSTLREKIVEHVFVGEVLRALWRMGIVDTEILRSEFDAFGYDLVVERGSTTRHVQLKSGLGKPNSIGVAEALSRKRSGCVVYINISEGLDLDQYYWFGSGPSEPLPPIDSFPFLKRPRPNREGVKVERKDYRCLPYKAFAGPMTLTDLLQNLLGI